MICPDRIEKIGKGFNPDEASRIVFNASRVEGRAIVCVFHKKEGGYTSSNYHPYQDSKGENQENLRSAFEDVQKASEVYLTQGGISSLSPKEAQ